MRGTRIGRWLACVGAVCLVTAPFASVRAQVRSYENSLRRAITPDGVAERLSISERMARWKVPGLSVAIIDNCEIVETRGFGVTRTGGAPVRPETLFQAASISKPVAALGALRLVDQGRLNLDEDIGTRLRSWTIPQSPLLDGHPVTLRGLLSHSAGLIPSGYGGYSRGAPLPTLVQVLEGVPPAKPKPVQVAYAPGSDWRYSGGGYLVAQLLMTDATGRAFAPLMRETVLTPLGMEDSRFEPPAAVATNVASGHGADGGRVEGEWRLYPELAAAGLWSTSPDLARFALAIMRAARSEPGATVSRSTASLMTEAQAGPRSLGFEVGGEGRSRHFGHEGTNEGYNGKLIVYPETCQGAVLLANSDNAKPLLNEIVRAIADVYGWPDAMPSAAVARIPSTPEIVAHFAGAYRFTSIPGIPPFRIVAGEAGDLTFDRGDGFTEPLLASPDGLFAPDSGVLIRSLDPSATSARTITYFRLGADEPSEAERVAPSEGEQP